MDIASASFVRLSICRVQDVQVDNEDRIKRGGGGGGGGMQNGAKKRGVLSNTGA